MAAKTENTGVAFAMFGALNLSAAVHNKALLVRIAIDENALQRATPSGSGKNMLIANSGGLIPLAIEGLPAGTRVNLVVTVPPPASTVTAKV